MHLKISEENGEIERAIYGPSHKDIKGKTCCLESYFSWLADLWASQLLLREDTFLPHEPKKSFLSLPWRPHCCIPHKTFCAPPRPLRLPGLADLLLLLRETSITGNTFSTTARPIMVKWDAMAGQEQHLLPCKSASVVSCSGCCDKTRSRGRASRWCVSIRPWRGNAHIWCGLYLLPALSLDDCRLSSFCKPCTSSEALKSASVGNVGFRSLGSFKNFYDFIYHMSTA